MRLIIYLDDMLVICDSQEELRENVLLIKDLFGVLGLTINEKKSQLEPSQEIVFMGYQLSTVTMTISLPVEKMQKIQQEALQLLKETIVSIWKIAAFIGMTNAARQAVTIALLFHRHLQALVNRALYLADSPETMKQKYHLQVDLTAKAREDLFWWSREATSHNAATIRVPPSDIVIEQMHLIWDGVQVVRN